MGEAEETEGGMKLIRMVYCHYDRKWLPMGRARALCPGCGAVVQDKRPTEPHFVELREEGA